MPDVTEARLLPAPEQRTCNLPIKMHELMSAALHKAQAEAKSIEKDATNAFHNYKYASAEAVITEGRRVLNAAGLALSTTGWEARVLFERKVTQTDGRQITEPQAIVRIGYALVHNKGPAIGWEADFPVVPEKGRPIDKAFAIALTASLSYTIRDLLCLPRVAPGEDMAGRVDPAEPGAAHAQTTPAGSPANDF